MPVISMFYGIIVRMFYMDNKKHHHPHVHVEYQDFKAVIQIPDGNIIAGDFPSSKLKLVQAWVEIHREDLISDWKLAVSGEPVFKIEALK